MKNPTALSSSPYSVEEWAELQTYSCSKTIQDSAEVELTSELFCQPIDIAIELNGDTTKAIENMDDYPLRSLQNCLKYLEQVANVGIRTIMLRMNSPKLLGDKEAIIKKQVSILKEIRKHYKSTDLDIIIDPFSIALNPNKTWGILNSKGELDYVATVELFSKMTAHFAEAGATYMLTLGRFEREVDATQRTLMKLANTPTKPASFSTNTETTNAYVYADHGAYAITKQKILVSNAAEMVFRALVDIHEGSQLVVVKPAENLHILEKIKTLLAHHDLLVEFLTSKNIEHMTEQSVYLRRVRSIILEDTDAFIAKAVNVRLGAYTVSGTYFIDMQTKQRKGSAFLRSLLYERFCNIASILQEREVPGLIIDRNACWYFQPKKLK